VYTLPEPDLPGVEIFSFDVDLRMSATRIRGVERIHAQLRAAIISGEYQPGAVLSQVELARNFGVSRTPLREALRRLEAEGLVESLQNRRARVATVDAESLDVLFTERILVEAMGIKVTVPYFTEIDLNDVLAATGALRVALEHADVQAQNQVRRSLHALYVRHAGQRLRSTIADQFDRCERYRRLYADLPPVVIDDYTAIANACVGRNADDVSRRLARIEFELAQAVLSRLDDAYEPTAIRTALQMLDRAGNL
jgi:DNA-binding GntR family transcriptional regulator